MNHTQLKAIALRNPAVRAEYDRLGNLQPLIDTTRAALHVAVAYMLASKIKNFLL